MTHGTEPAAVASGWKADRKYRNQRQRDARQRRDDREQAAQLRERYVREAIPRNDDAPLPRID